MAHDADAAKADGTPAPDGKKAKARLKRVRPKFMDQVPRGANLADDYLYAKSHPDGAGAQAMNEDLMLTPEAVDALKPILSSTIEDANQAIALIESASESTEPTGDVIPAPLAEIIMRMVARLEGETPEAEAAEEGGEPVAAGTPAAVPAGAGAAPAVVPAAGAAAAPVTMDAATKASACAAMKSAIDQMGAALAALNAGGDSMPLDAGKSYGGALEALKSLKPKKLPPAAPAVAAAADPAAIGAAVAAKAEPDPADGAAAVTVGDPAMAIAAAAAAPVAQPVVIQEPVSETVKTNWIEQVGKVRAFLDEAIAAATAWPATPTGCLYMPWDVNSRLWRLRDLVDTITDGKTIDGLLFVAKGLEGITPEVVTAAKGLTAAKAAADIAAKAGAVLSKKNITGLTAAMDAIDAVLATARKEIATAEAAPVVEEQVSAKALDEVAAKAAALEASNVALTKQLADAHADLARAKAARVRPASADIGGTPAAQIGAKGSESQAVPTSLADRVQLQRIAIGLPV